MMRLVAPHPSHDTVACLEDLLERARSGELRGMAFVAYFRRRTFSYGATGEAIRSPVMTLGTLAVLEDALLTAAKRSDP